MVPHVERPQFHGPLLKRTRCQHTSLKENLWMKAQHEGALTPACIVQKNPQVPQTFRQVACHPVNNSKGKRRSIPQQKTRCAGIRFFSRVDREIGVFRHVAPPTRLRLELPHETSLILRCARKVGNPLQTDKGSRPSCRNQERRRGSDEVVPGYLGVPLE